MDLSVRHFQEQHQTEFAHLYVDEAEDETSRLARLQKQQDILEGMRERGRVMRMSLEAENGESSALILQLY